MGCCRTLLKTSSKTVNLFKITKYVNGTQHSGDHGNSDMERKPPTGTRQFGGIEASLAQAEIVEAVKLQVFREVCQAKLHWNILFSFWRNIFYRPSKSRQNRNSFMFASMLTRFTRPVQENNVIWEELDRSEICAKKLGLSGF